MPTKPKLGDVRYRLKPASIVHKYRVELFFGGKWHLASYQHSSADALEVKQKVRGVIADIIREARETRDA